MEDTSPTETLPFTPDELWNFHRPQHSSTPRRMSSIRPPSSRLSLGRELPMLQEKAQVPTSDTMVCSADFDYDCYEPYRVASPPPPPPTVADAYASPPETPISSIFPSNSISSHRSKSSSISSLSLDGQPVSSKAAKMLGIDPSATMIANYPGSGAAPLVADAPDRYNSHRTQTWCGMNPQPVFFLPTQTWFTPDAAAAAAAAAPQPPAQAPPSQLAYDPALDTTRIRKALKKSKKPDCELLSTTLVSISREPCRKLALCRQRYREFYGEDMVSEVRAGTSGNYRLALTRLMAGPHGSEALALKQSEASYFMDDKLVAEALFGKDPADINHIKHHFELAHGIALKKALANLYLTDTQPSGSVFDAAGPSAVFGQACIRTLRADREVETIETLAALDGEALMRREKSMIRDVEELYRARKGDRRAGGADKHLDLDMLLETVMQRSPLYLAEVCRRFQERHGKQLPELVLAKDKARMIPGSYYPAALGYAVAFVLNGATNKPQRDAKLLEDCMKGLSTNDARLIARVIRMHYDPDPRHMLFVKEVYQQRYGRTLAERLRKDTKGAYREVLLKVVEGRTDLGAEAFF